MEILRTCLSEIALSGLEGEFCLMLHLPLALQPVAYARSLLY